MSPPRYEQDALDPELFDEVQEGEEGQLFGEAEDSSDDPSSAEYEGDPSSAEYEPEAEFDSELDPELFEGGVSLGLTALIAAKIGAGQRDVNALTNDAFFTQHPELPRVPLKRGQEALMKEWKALRDELVQPLLDRAPGAGTIASAGDGSFADDTTPHEPLGTLVFSAPKQKPLRYTFTRDDLVAAAKMMIGESGGDDNPYNRGTLWALINRYAFLRNKTPSWGSFAGFLKAYSQSLRPIAKWVSVKELVAKCNSTFSNKECHFRPTSTELYPGTKIPMGTTKRIYETLKTPWNKLPVSARKLAFATLTGQIPNPIGNATDVADTKVYYARKFGQRPTREQWRQYTQNYADTNGFVWSEDSIPFDQFAKHALFTKAFAKDFPAGAARILPPAAGAPAPAPVPAPTPRTPAKPTATSPVVAPPPPPAGGYDGKKPAPGTTQSRKSWEVTPPLTNAPGNRSRAAYDQVLNQFAAGVNPRYAQKRNDAGRIVSTYCNIFVWDATRAMGAEVPHWTKKNGDPSNRNDKAANELNANALNDWLHQHGPRFGWRQVTLQEGIDLANKGYPIVASWKNKEKKPGAKRAIGHIAMVRPGTPHPEAGPWMAQAGGVNANYIRMFHAGGQKGVWKKTTAVEIFAHE